ncbi:GNAT family N-acetyltransferase [Sporanaerobium hydrogeniformans]|uniref:GNAT family N-acetyltransferase n=1 Tax=Sporanaerobium hydrogeniformans TaxID=3072179 RepID=A0AC61DHM0_9FIRM|nr:GNAT family N-acetyltransferase [Sporanaerobium hydrogeniformans]PHV72290.1 GNAT family N-acetyltransferase [Sporanaerobium hydrogeniformans]
MILKYEHMNGDYGEAAWRIYEESFPRIERRRKEDHQSAMADEAFKPLVVLDGEQLVGILFYWKWKDCTYLEHLAFEKACRGRGYGSQVIRDFCQKEQDIVLEIEPPEDEIAIKRLRFYERLGFQMNPYNHLNLPYRKDLGKHMLKIMSYQNCLSQGEYDYFNHLLITSAGAYCEK